MSFLTFLPHKVEGHSVVTIDNQLFIIGGFDSFGVTDRIIKVDLKYMSCTVLDEDCRLKHKRENSTS